jgi:hypothetical protein
MHDLLPLLEEWKKTGDLPGSGSNVDDEGEGTRERGRGRGAHNSGGYSVNTQKEAGVGVGEGEAVQALQVLATGRMRNILRTRSLSLADFS